MKLISGDQLTAIKRVKSFKIGKELAGRYVPPEEQMSMIRICWEDKTDMGARDCAILSLMFSCGLRRLEVVDLDRSRDDQYTLLVRGKGDKERKAFISGGGLAYLKDYLPVRGDWSGCLFPACGKWGDMRGDTRISNRGMSAIFTRRAQQSGIEKCRPHDARRSAATTLLMRGVDPFIVSRLLGHSQIQTTLRYDIRPEEDARKASRLAEIEYLGTESKWPGQQISYRTDDEPRAEEQEERSGDGQHGPLKPLSQELFPLE